MFTTLANSSKYSSARKKSSHYDNEHKYFSKLQENYEGKVKTQHDMIYRLGLLLLDSVIGGFDAYETEMKNYEHVKYEINILDYILTNSKCEIMKL